MLSMLVAFGIALITTLSVYAAFQYVDESSGNFTQSGNLWTVSTCYQSSSECYLSNAKYRWSSNNSWGKWTFSGKTTFEVWIPKPYGNDEYGTVRYHMTGTDTEYTVVTQSK
jgi:hypothetical protein